MRHKKSFPVKGDWIKLLNNDKEIFEINISDDELIKKFKTKNSFKNFLKKKAKEVTINYLKELKNKHSKLDDIAFTELKCASYLTDQRISQREAKLLFKLRTCMYQVKINFKELHKNDLSCDLCKSATCDQSHLLQCKVLHKLIPELRFTKVKYHHLFGGIENMIPAIKLFKKVTEERDKILQVLSKSSKR